MKNDVLSQLTLAKSTIASTLEVCLSSNKVKELNAVLSAARKQTTEAIASVVEHPNKRNLTQTRKSLTVIDNLLGGLIEGITSKELSPKEFRAVCGTLQSKFIPTFEESISSELDKFKAEAGIVEGEDDAELTEDQQDIRNAILAAGTTEEEEVSEDEEEESEHDREARIKQRAEEERQVELDGIAGDVGRRLTRLRGMRKLLPQRMQTPYSVLRLPVVPNFETEAAKNPVLLEKLSIPFTEIPLHGSGVPVGLNKVKMERYVIFEQQQILLISKDYVNQLLQRKTGERDAEVKEVIGDKKGRIKDYKSRIDNATAEIEKANNEIPTIRAEIKRLSDKLDAKMRDRVVTSLLLQVDGPAEKKLVAEIAELEQKLKAHNVEKAEQVSMRAEVTKAIETLYKQRVAKSKGKPKIAKEVEQVFIIQSKLHKNNAQLLNVEQKIETLEANKRSAETQITKTQDSVKETRKAVKRSGAPITSEDYARSVLSVINERTGSKYALVTPIAAPNPRNARGILCFWIMPSSKLSAMMKATGGKAKVTQWDFPFESERHVQIQEERKGWVHPSDDPSNADFLEFAKNKHHRPEGWKSRYGKPAKRID